MFSTLFHIVHYLKQKVFTKQSSSLPQLETNDADRSAFFHSINCHDLVWAKMPLSDSELKRIPPGHEIRPYFIVAKQINSVLAFACTSTPQRTLPAHQYYPCIDFSKRFYKSSFMLLHNLVTLPAENLLKIMYTAKPKDVEQIEKRLYLTRQYGNTAMPMLNIAFAISKGDIVIYQHWETAVYYIYQEDNTNLYGIRLRKKENITSIPKSKPFYLTIKKTTYQFDFTQRTMIPKTSNLELIGLTTKTQQIEIEHLKKKVKVIIPTPAQSDHLEANYTKGAMFSDRSRQIYTLLYIYNDRPYGIKNDLDKKNPCMIRIKNLQAMDYIGMRNMDDVNRMIDKLLCKHIDPHHILSEVRKKQ